MLHNSKHGSLSRRMISNTLKQLQNMSAHVFPMRFSRSCFCLCLHFIQAIPHPEMDRPPGSRNTSGGEQPVLHFLYLEITKPNQGCEKGLTMSSLMHP